MTQISPGWLPPVRAFARIDSNCPTACIAPLIRSFLSALRYGQRCRAFLLWGSSPAAAVDLVPSLTRSLGDNSPPKPLKRLERVHGFTRQFSTTFCVMSDWLRDERLAEAITNFGIAATLDAVSKKRRAPSAN